jgi:hypothetical protein
MMKGRAGSGGRGSNVTILQGVGRSRSGGRFGGRSGGRGPSFKTGEPTPSDGVNMIDMKSDPMKIKKS